MISFHYLYVTLKQDYLHSIHFHSFLFFFFILGRSTLQPLLRGPKLFILGHDDAQSLSQFGVRLLNLLFQDLHLLISSLPRSQQRPTSSQPEQPLGFSLEGQTPQPVSRPSRCLSLQRLSLADLQVGVPPMRSITKR